MTALGYLTQSLEFQQPIPIALSTLIDAARYDGDVYLLDDLTRLWIRGDELSITVALEATDHGIEVTRLTYHNPADIPDEFACGIPQRNGASCYRRHVR